jgi:hypothetical protein
VPRLLRFGCAALVAALLPAMVCAQTTAPSAPPRPISDAQVAKLFSDLATNGVNGPIPSGITTALGLTRAGETLNVRQDTVIDSADASKAAHTFLKLGNGNVVVAKVNEDGSGRHVRQRYHGGAGRDGEGRLERRARIARNDLRQALIARRR